MNAFVALHHLSLFTSTEGQNNGMNVTVQQTGDFGQCGDSIMYRQDVPDTEDVLLAQSKRKIASKVKEVPSRAG
jgi:hypothetical protein